MVIRLTLPMMSVLAVIVLAACSESPPPSPEPTVAPTVVPTSTPAPTPSPTPVVPFKESLLSADLARFQTLPVEIQEALVNESLESGNDSALGYLRDMPDDAVPVSEILPSDTRTLFDSLDEPTRRQLLLEGYPNATLPYLKKQWLAGEISDLDYRYGSFESTVLGAHQLLFEDGHLLPPLEDTLSPTAFKRFESLDLPLQESFRLVWQTTRSLSIDDAADELEQDLLNVPLTMPGTRDLDLPSETASVLEREPELWSYAQRVVASILVRDQEWSSDGVNILQQSVEAYEAPGGREALERGLLPGGEDPWLAMVCLPPSLGGVSLDEAVLPVFRDLHPARLVYYWPAPEDALSDAALANFNLLDETMLEAFEIRWYGHAVPKEARFMACLIARWDRGIADTPFTSMPGPDVFLPEDKRKFYDELTDHEKWATELELAVGILKGEILFHRDRFGQTEHVSTFNSTPEEFIEGLRFSAVESLCGFHPAACR